MISTPPAALIPDADTTAPHPRQANMDGLIHAGVITHLVSVEESLDPLFAVAQMRDLPEVQFVAAFEDGLIALGCPEKLPDELKELATPAQATVPPPEASPPAPMAEDALKRIDRTAQQLEYLLDALQPDEATSDEDRLRPLIDRLGALEERLERPFHDPAIKSVKEQLTGLHRRFDGLDNRPDGVPITQEHLAPLGTRLEGIEARLDALTEQSAEPDQSEALGAIQRSLDHLIGQQATPPPAMDLSAVLEAIDALSMKMEQPPALPDELADQLSTIKTEVSQLVDAPAPAIDLTAQEAKFDQFASVLTMIVNRIEGTAMDIKSSLGEAKATSGHEELGARLDRLLEAPPPEPVDLSPLAARIEGLETTMAPWPDRLAELAGDVKALAAQPQTKSDLDEQRRTLATFSTTLSGVVQRLEAAVADISAREPGPIADLAETNALVQNVLQHVDALATDEPDFSAVTTRLDEVVSETKALPETLAALETKLDAIAERPAPVLDLTAQRADFARFGTALSNVVKRIEATLEAQGKDDGAEALQASLSEISTRLEALPDREMLDGRWTEGITAVQQAIDALATRPDPHEAQLETLREDIGNLLKRPDPVMDMTAQRQAFARFGTALNAALARLETVISALETDAEEHPGPADEMMAVVRALPEILDKSVRQATDLEPVTTALGVVQRDVSTLPDRMGLTDLNEAVHRLAQRPDPVIDLTAQRQSFARFGTAIATVIERLDTIAQELAAAGTEPAQLTTLAETILRLEAQMQGQTKDHETKLDSLSAQIAALSQKMQTLSKATADGPQQEGPAGVPISLEELRLQFAELIAAQIKQNAASFHPGGQGSDRT